MSSASIFFHQQPVFSLNDMWSVFGLVLLENSLWHQFHADLDCQSKQGETAYDRVNKGKMILNLITDRLSIIGQQLEQQISFTLPTYENVGDSGLKNCSDSTSSSCKSLDTAVEHKESKS
jgi:hypothetical protein